MIPEPLSGAMLCRYCQSNFAYKTADKLIGNDILGAWYCLPHFCPNCKRFNFDFYVAQGLYANSGLTTEGNLFGRMFDWPTVLPQPCPPEVPSDLAEDYMEAAAVLSISPKASAALSRRCLQTMLREQGYNRRDLSDHIDDLLASKTLPSQIAEMVDAIRNIGNFAAHPNKNLHTGEILAVEPEEAEWNLEVLRALFDFYYVAPAKNQARIDALNAKLASSGKQPIKEPPA